MMEDGDRENKKTASSPKCSPQPRSNLVPKQDFLFFQGRDGPEALKPGSAQGTRGRTTWFS